MRSTRAVVALAATAVLVAACGGDQRDDSQLSLGYLLPESGPLAFLGPPQIEAVRLAVADINAAGGVLGKDVKLTSSDEAGDEAIARQSAERLIGEGVQAVVGAAASGMTLATISLFHDNQVVMCSASNTSPALTDHESNAFYFRTAPPDQGQTPVLAERIVQDGKRRVAILARSDDYGRSFLDLLSDNLVSQGATVTAAVVYDANASSFTGDVQQAIAGNPDAVVIIGFDESAQVIQGLLEAGYTADQLYGADGNKSNELAAIVDPANPGVLAGFTGTAPGADKDFSDRLAPLLPNPNTIYGGQAYDCAIAIALAVIAAGTADPEVFVAQMTEVVGNGGTKCTAFAECKALLEAGEAIDYDGPSGPIEWRSSGAMPSFATYEIWQTQADGSVAQIGSTAVQLD
jgi:branched-chain amino acid transport system substrate-binding protein